MFLSGGSSHHFLRRYKRYGCEPVLNPKDKNQAMRWDDVELIVMANAKSHEVPAQPAERKGADIVSSPSPSELGGAGSPIAMIDVNTSNLGGWCKKNALERVQAELVGLQPDQKQAVLDRVMALTKTS